MCQPGFLRLYCYYLVEVLIFCWKRATLAVSYLYPRHHSRSRRNQLNQRKEKRLLHLVHKVLKSPLHLLLQQHLHPPHSRSPTLVLLVQELSLVCCYSALVLSTLCMFFVKNVFLNVFWSLIIRTLTLVCSCTN